MLQGQDQTGAIWYRPPKMCGLGQGQHMYLQAHPAQDVDATVTIVLGSSTSGRKWSIRVTQVINIIFSFQGKLKLNTKTLTFA